MPAPITAPVPSPVDDVQGRLTITMMVDKSISTTSTTTGSNLVFVSRLLSNDMSSSTKVTPKVEVGTDGYTGGTAGLGSFKGKLQRDAVSPKLMGLICNKKQNATSGQTTAWTYRDRATAKFDYARLIADSTGFVYGAFVGLDAELSDYEIQVKAAGDAEETYTVMGKHLVETRTYPIGKNYVVVSGDVATSTSHVAATFGPNEVPIAIVAPSGGNPPNALYQSGRRYFLKVAFVPSTNRTIAGNLVKAGQSIRLSESDGAPASGQCQFSTGTGNLLFGDPIVAGDQVRLLFESYGSDSTPTQVSTASLDTTDEPGVPGRVVPVTISTYGIPGVQTFSAKEQYGKKEVQGAGENEVRWGSASIQNTTYNVDLLAKDFNITQVLQTGGLTPGANNDIYPGDYTTRYMLHNTMPLQADLHSPNSNTLILLSVIGNHPVFETPSDLSGQANGDLSRKVSGIDIGTGLSISVTTP